MSDILHKWQHPQYYMGETYEEYYVILSQNRDSDDIDVSNFEVATKQLGGEGKGVLIARASHWAVGWVELLLVHESAPDKIKIAEKIVKALEDYPVLDDEDYSNRQWDRAVQYWKSISYDERKALCQRFNIPVKEARKTKSLPSDDNGALFDYLTTP